MHLETGRTPATDRPRPSAGPSELRRSPGRDTLLGRALVEEGVLNEDQLADALARQAGDPDATLAQTLADTGQLTGDQIASALAEQLGIPTADLAAVEVPEETTALIGCDLARRFACLPLFVEGRDLYLVMSDPTDVEAADAVGFHTGLRTRPVAAAEHQIQAALQRYYGIEADVEARLAGDLGEQIALVGETEPVVEAQDEGDAASAAPVVKLVNSILADAIRAGASDVHIEPQPRGVELRYRVDGLLRRVTQMQRRIHRRVASRIKITAGMDISETRRPQDGRSFVRVGGKSYDLRVSSLPTADGEKLVLRILAQDRATVSLESLGLEEDSSRLLRSSLARPQGMILVTGPTGSGKTSTLYAALNALRSESRSIVTVEDPVEYRLAGASQVAVSPRAGLTFAAGLRSILRQDPDVIMVGEIRDLETAEVAFQAAQTGHLVLSTLHTNDAPSAMTRLVQMGLPAYVVASSLIAAVSQRLVRRLCSCHAVQPDGTASPVGCERCRYQGYQGRLAVFELMPVSRGLRTALANCLDDDSLRREAAAAGMRTLWSDGMMKVEAGLTTLDEIARVIPPDEDETRLPQPSPLPSASTPESDAASRVLVVDDDRLTRNLIRMTLEKSRIDVIEATDGGEALAAVYKHRPDLVLTDLSMPGLDGFDLLRKLRADLSTCQIPVVMLTASGDSRSEVEALELGADDYIAKPLDRERLVGRVRRALLRARTPRGVPTPN